MKGALLSCERCKQLRDHNVAWMQRNKSSWGFNVCSVPRLIMRSPLFWYPSLETVCVFPILEGVSYGGIMAEYDVHRPLFYTEFRASRYGVLKGRLRLVKSLGHKKK